MVITWLQGHDGRAAAGPLTGIGHRKSLGMSLTFASVVALADELLVPIEDDAADCGFGLVVPSPKAESAMARRIAASSCGVTIMKRW